MLSNVITHYQKIGVTSVTGSTARAGKACSGKTTVTPDFFGVTDQRRHSEAVTPVTPAKNAVLPLEAAPDKAVTPVLPVTPPKQNTQPNAQINERDRRTLTAYLAAIGEDDQALIDEYLAECAADPVTLAKQLDHARRILMEMPQDPPQTQIITCRSCANFQSYNHHGGGAGVCTVGVQPFGACWWSEARHECDQYLETETEMESL